MNRTERQQEMSLNKLLEIKKTIIEKYNRRKEMLDKQEPPKPPVWNDVWYQEQMGVINPKIDAIVYTQDPEQKQKLDRLVDLKKAVIEKYNQRKEILDKQEPPKPPVWNDVWYQEQLEQVNPLIENKMMILEDKIEHQSPFFFVEHQLITEYFKKKVLPLIKQQLTEQETEQDPEQETEQDPEQETEQDPEQETLLDKHIVIFKDCTTKALITSIPVLTSIGLAKLGVIDSTTPQSMVNLGFSAGIGLAKLGISGVRNTLVTGAASLVIYNQVDPYKRGLFEGFVVGKYGPTLERVKNTTSYLYSRMINTQTPPKPLEPDVSTTTNQSTPAITHQPPQQLVEQSIDNIPKPDLNIVTNPPKMPILDDEPHSIWEIFTLLGSITWKLLKKIQYFLS